MTRPAMPRTLTAIATGILVAATTNLLAIAQAAPSRSELRQACGTDVRSLCAGVMPGGGRIKQCMIEKRDQLSDGCKNAMKEARTPSSGK